MLITWICNIERSVSRAKRLKNRNYFGFVCFISIVLYYNSIVLIKQALGANWSLSLPGNVFELALGVEAEGGDEVLSLVIRSLLATAQ